MNRLSISDERKAEIASVVRSLWVQAGVEPSERQASIAPLYDIICHYPIRVAELSQLTYRQAAQFLAAETGQSIQIPGDHDRPLAGFLYIYEFAGALYGCILVKKEDPIERRRFSAAHELGHYALHFLPLLKLQANAASPEALTLAEGLSYEEESDGNTEVPSGQLAFARGVRPFSTRWTQDLQQAEVEANQFAAEVLMPSGVCEKLINNFERESRVRESTLIRRLAGELLVSREAMRRRLSELNAMDLAMAGHRR
jgi:hypothetical protein